MARDEECAAWSYYGVKANDFSRNKRWLMSFLVFAIFESCLVSWDGWSMSEDKGNTWNMSLKNLQKHLKTLENHCKHT
jgi:hypothetical protein